MASTRSSTGLAIPVPVKLQGERQGRAKKRTIAEIHAAEASTLPQPAAAKRQRKAPGAYKYLDGAEGVQKSQTPASNPATIQGYHQMIHPMHMLLQCCRHGPGWRAEEGGAPGTGGPPQEALQGKEQDCSQPTACGCDHP